MHLLKIFGVIIFVGWDSGFVDIGWVIFFLLQLILYVIFIMKDIVE